MKVLASINRIVHSASAILLGVMTILVLIQVLFRYVLKIPLTTSEELARFSMIWMVMLGSTVAIRNKTHVAVTYFVELLPEAVQKVTRIITYVFIILFFGVLVIYGYDLSGTAMNQLGTATHIPMGYIIVSIPIGAAISVLYVIEEMIHDLRGTHQINEQTFDSKVGGF